MIIDTKLGHSFDIQPIEQIQLLNRAGIYTIWTQNFDESFTILYVGETGDFEQRIDKTHHKYSDWLRNNRKGLYIHIYLMPSAKYSKEIRLATEQNLIMQYNPICNG